MGKFIDEYCIKAYVRLTAAAQNWFKSRKGQGAVEYIVGAAVLVLLIFGMYKLLQANHALEGVANWFKKTFTSGAKNYKV
jgi:hypothetical protein